MKCSITTKHGFDLLLAARKVVESSLHFSGWKVKGNGTEP